MPRKWLIAIALLVVLAAGGVAIRLRAHKLKPAPAAPAPPAAVPANPDDFVGRVQPRTVIQVAAPMEGTLEAFFVDVNQEVYKDQLLGRIRNANLENAQNQAQLDFDKAQTSGTTLDGDQLAVRLEASRASVDQSRARADVDRLEKIYQNQKKLWDLGATARLAFEKAQKDYTEARAASDRADASVKRASERTAAIDGEIEAAKRAVTDAAAALDRAKAELANEEIHSPADGIVIARRGQPGEPVDPSMKDLLQLGTDLTLLQVTVTPDPATLARIRAGQAASVKVPAISPDEMPGTVREVRGSDVIVDFTNPVPLSKLDVTAQVRIKF
ncbi:MAG TPA: biotin/lipoyl-binding protein [Rhizomicrobium sp.]|nr:biotin/lipoyl-binding protein [Rhizomicrobium sp.]